MKRKGIKNIVFDFGGVLIDLDRQRCIDGFKELGLTFMEEMVDPFAQQGIFMQLEKGQITPAEFREKIREISGKPLTDESIDEAWNSFLGDIPVYKLETLLKLREKNLVYLLSNTNEIHWEWARTNAFPYKSFRETDYFEQTFLSYKMRMAKPSIDIFKAILDEAGLAPQETLFIDDSEANCLAAKTLGISVYNCKPGEDWRHLFK